MNNVYEILEICLQEIENGVDIDSVLFRYPEHAEELRPMLEVSVHAKSIASPEASADVIRRNRSKVLQHAAQMREAKAPSARRLWSVPLRRALVTLIVVGVLFISSTGLVRAASTTLPGDNLYPVKRTWEDVNILFTFNVQTREALEVEHENERLDELKNVFAAGRSVPVDFSGLVTRQNADLWLIAGVPVAVSAQTELPTQSIVVGNAVHVLGMTQKDGAVLAQRIELLSADTPLPEVGDDNSFELEQENSGASNQAGEDNSGKGSGSETPKIEATQSSEIESGSGSSSQREPKDQSVSGVVDSINGNIVVVNGQIMNVSNAEIKGTPKVGTAAKVEGYYDANGLFVVTEIEFQSSGSGDGGSVSGSNDGGSNSGSNTSGGGADDSGGSGGSGGGGDSGSSGGGGD